MKKIVFLLLILSLAQIGFSQADVNYNPQWVIFCKTLSNNLSFDFSQDQYEVLVIGNPDLVAEFNKVATDDVNNMTRSFGGKIVKARGTPGTGYGYQPYMIFVDKSASFAQIQVLSAKYPKSLILTNHTDHIKTYNTLSKTISVFVWGAHIRSLGNPLESFEMNKVNFSKSVIMMSTDITTLFVNFRQ